MNGGMNVPVQKPVLGPAEHLLGRQIDEGDSPLGVKRVHAFRGAVHKRPQEAEVFLERLLRAGVLRLGLAQGGQRPLVPPLPKPRLCDPQTAKRVQRLPLLVGEGSWYPAQNVKCTQDRALRRDERHARIEAPAAPTERASVSLPVEELRAGQVLARDVQTPDGILLIGAGRRLTEALLERLRNFTALGLVREPVRVECERLKNTALARALRASPLLSPAWTRQRSWTFCSQSSVNSVRSKRPSSRSATASPFWRG